MYFFLCLCSFIFSLSATEEYNFYGRHFLASYLDCDEEALSDTSALLTALDAAVAASHATILKRNEVIFPPNGLTAVYVLSESHASIHTYPERGSCFVDIFTCGTRCSEKDFDRLMRNYLKPKRVAARTFLRHELIEELN